MKNLTNIQLSVLTNAFTKKVGKKLDTLRKTPEYLRLVEASKKKYNYNKALFQLKKIKAIEQEMLDLDKLRQKHQAKYSVLAQMSKYQHNQQTLEEKIKRAAEEHIMSLVPSKNEIEAEIVLMSLDKTTDILNALDDKFDIT